MSALRDYIARGFPQGRAEALAELDALERELFDLRAFQVRALSESTAEPRRELDGEQPRAAKETNDQCDG